jgi:MFS family permease
MDENETVTQATVTVRRSPRYARFMLVGVIVFAILALILTYAFPESSEYGTAQVFGFLLLLGAAVGLGLGAIAALVADRLSRRRARTLIADRLYARARIDETAEPDAASDSHTPTQS